MIVSTSHLFNNYLIGQDDNQLFGNQVFDWLAGPSWLAPLLREDAPDLWSVRSLECEFPDIPAATMK